MVDLSSLSLLALVFGALELAAIIVALGWIGRFVRKGREQRLAAEVKGDVGSLRAIGARRRATERVIVGTGVLSLGAVGWGFVNGSFQLPARGRDARPRRGGLNELWWQARR